MNRRMTPSRKTMQRAFRFDQNGLIRGKKFKKYVMEETEKNIQEVLSRVTRLDDGNFSMTPENADWFLENLFGIKRKNRIGF